MSKIITKKEYNKRRVKLQVAAGFWDFFVTIACAAVTFGCVILLFELYAWLKGDIPVTFGKFFSIIERALRINGG